MNDLISRQAAIDAFGDIHPLDYNAQAYKARIEKLPSAQPEIIRCKDCNHWTTMVERPKHGTCDQWCTLNVTRRDEYCSRAERKES